MKIAILDDFDTLHELQFAAIFDQIVAYAAGAPINVVNPEALHRAN